LRLTDPLWHASRNLAEAMPMLELHILGLLGANAEGPTAIGALVLIVVLLVLPAWWRR
jgi:hypothetical protein